MKHLKRVGMFVAVGILTLEALLQIAAVVAYCTSGDGPEVASDGPAVLCIGDSYTYGLGATSSEYSYPGHLQGLLRKRGVDGTVVNSGWPGKNSREALLHLRAQLDKYRPAVAVVLIGLNDTWTRPEAVDWSSDTVAGDVGPQWQWRLRSWRLVRLLLGGQDGEVAEPTAIDPSSPEKHGSDDGAGDGVIERAVALMQAGDNNGALTLLRRGAASGESHAPECHQGLVQVLTAVGRRDEAQESLDWLAEAWQLRPSREVAEAYSVALNAAGQVSVAAETARAGAAKYPESATLWWISGNAYYDSGDLPAAERAYDRAIDAARESDDTRWRAALFRHGAKSSSARDTEKAVRQLIQSLELDGDVERCRVIVTGAEEHFAPSVVKPLLASLPMSDDVRPLAQRLFAASWPTDPKLFETLDQHLRQIVAMVRESGSKPILLTYPIRTPEVEATQRRVAAALEVPLVAILPAFRAALGRYSREELYIPDGHCSDLGYGLMAQQVLVPVIELLRADK